MMKYHAEIFTGNSFKVQILYTVNNRKQNIRLTFSNILEHITIHPTHYISRKCIETYEYVIKQSPTVDKRHQFNTNFHAYFPVTKDDIISYIYTHTHIYIYIDIYMGPKFCHHCVCRYFTFHAAFSESKWVLVTFVDRMTSFKMADDISRKASAIRVLMNPYHVLPPSSWLGDSWLYKVW